MINHIYSQFDVTANILYGNIEILEDTPVGEMVVVLEGQANNVEATASEFRTSRRPCGDFKEGRIESGSDTKIFTKRL